MRSSRSPQCLCHSHFVIGLASSPEPSPDRVSPPQEPSPSTPTRKSSSPPSSTIEPASIASTSASPPAPTGIHTPSDDPKISTILDLNAELIKFVPVSLSFFFLYRSLSQGMHRLFSSGDGWCPPGVLFTVGSLPFACISMLNTPPATPTDCKAI